MLFIIRLMMLWLMASNSHAAALMGFEDSTMLMSEANRYSQEFMVNYSPTVGHAFGVEVMRMSPRDDASTTMTGVNYTGLLKRWNLPNAQANVWFSGALGEAQGAADGLAYSPSLQFDYETTRVYFLAKSRWIRAPGMKNDTAAIQAGVSFFETGFDETQPWFVVEAKTIRDFSPSLQITPAIRLINKNFFFELGVTNPFQGQGFTPRVDAMFVF